MMIRPFTRVLSAAVVILALALVLASPVQAAPTKAPRLTKVGSNFLDAALNWLNGFLTDAGSATADQPRATEKGRSKPGSGTGTGGTVIAYTGSCIDPLGNPCVVYPTP